MGQWLEHANDSLTAYRDGHPARASATSNGFSFSDVDQLAIVNVAIQVERLAHHAIVAPAVASGALQIVGLFFDFSTVHVHEVDQRGIVSAETADAH